ncbi:membrane-associated phospholipase C2 [Mycobacterium ulcerans subsp. shinshuense]|uniref:phospholipase C n=1 Tax=Mycobacterium ulcerans subsp. shinshuense TaxID=1124626 RepID=A0A1B4Y685_MYCUL|nr:membrane-associated phospholipase C2 [Mycobacterium ulcerans subsp. shinshuense]
MERSRSRRCRTGSADSESELASNTPVDLAQQSIAGVYRSSHKRTGKVGGEQEPRRCDVASRVFGQGRRRQRGRCLHVLGRPGHRKGLRSGAMFGSPERHRAHRVVHAGEPVVRPLLRQAFGHQRIRRGSPLFAQKGWNPQTQSNDPAGTTIPYRFDTTRGPLVAGECVNDPGHDWIAMHNAWNNGGNDNWLPAQAAVSALQGNTPVTMGYYQREDIPIHYLLADTFTICDGYFCSLIGGTSPNRLYWMSGTIDPDGANGGPLLVDPNIQPQGRFSWRTMPDNLEDAGVSWKIYQNKLLGALNNTVIGYDGMLNDFKQAQNPRTNLARYGIAPTYPRDFVSDVRNNRLPKVSWVLPGFLLSEHPAFPVNVGAVAIVDVLRILLSNPAVWEKTALIVSYDENGGFFDHVTPTTAPPGTPGEWITVPNIDAVTGSGGIRGPIGLGYRVPCFVISPYSRGPLMVHDTFDHTSQLKLIETRFGVPVPNISAWRNGLVGDMTSTFNFAVPPNSSRPNLSHPAINAVQKLPQCVPNYVLGAVTKTAVPYRVPFPQVMPTQETQPARGIPNGLC